MACVQRDFYFALSVLAALRHRSRGVVLRFAQHFHPSAAAAPGTPACPWLTYFAPLALEVRIPQSCTSNLNPPYEKLPNLQPS